MTEWTRGTDPIADLEQVLCRGVTTIFDVGANVGRTVKGFADRCPDAKLFAFEPTTEAYKALVAATAGLDRVQCFHLALGAQPGREQMHYHVESVWNSLSQNDDRGLGSELVTIETLDEVAGALGVESIDLVKSDTEGYDLEVLKGADGYLRRGRIRSIFVEMGFQKRDRGHTFFADVHDYLSGRNYQLHSFYSMGGLTYVSHPISPRYSWCDALFIHNDVVEDKERLPYESFLRWLDDQRQRLIDRR